MQGKNRNQIVRIPECFDNLIAKDQGVQILLPSTKNRNIFKSRLKSFIINQKFVLLSKI
jgi:hypothetical protein